MLSLELVGGASWLLFAEKWCGHKPATLRSGAATGHPRTAKASSSASRGAGMSRDGEYDGQKRKTSYSSSSSS